MNAADREKLYADQVGLDALARQRRASAPKCRSCDRPMRWVDTNRGRKMPVDYDPHEDGNVVVHANGRADVYRDTPTSIPDGATLHFSHFATCPNADAHREIAVISSLFSDARQEAEEWLLHFSRAGQPGDGRRAVAVPR